MVKSRGLKDSVSVADQNRIGYLIIDGWDSELREWKPGRGVDQICSDMQGGGSKTSASYVSALTGIEGSQSTEEKCYQTE